MAGFLFAVLLGTSIFFFVSYVRGRESEMALKKRVDKDRKREIKGPMRALLLKPLERLTELNRKLPAKYRNSYAGKLELSGSGQKKSPEAFLAQKELCSMLVLFLAMIFSGGIGIIPVAFAAGAFFLPDIELKNSREKYERKMSKALPYAIDILSTCVEAGLTFDAAVAKYIENDSGGIVAVELQAYSNETRLGKSRKEALKSLALRVGMPEFSSVISTVSKSIEYGTGIAPALKQQAAQLRFMRSQRAEKAAAQAPVKLLFPLLLFIFPVVFLVIFGPVLLRLFLNR